MVLPSIPGIRNDANPTINFTKEVANYIEQNCRAEWLELHRISHANQSSSPLVPVHIWQQTREGQMHRQLMSYFMDRDNWPKAPLNWAFPELSEVNRMWSRLQSQRYEVRGKRAKFEARAKSATAYRKYRSWWISKLLAEKLSLPFTELCPFEKYVQPGPPESYIIIGEHFEEWTGHKLPADAWAMLKSIEANRLESQAKLGIEANRLESKAKLGIATNRLEHGY